MSTLDRVAAGLGPIEAVGVNPEELVPAAFPTDAAGQLHVLGHDGDALGVDGAEVGVLEEVHKVGLRRLLEGQDGVGLEAQVRLELLGHLPDEALKRAPMKRCKVKSCKVKVAK